MPKGQCSSVSIYTTKCKYAAYTSRIFYHHAIAQGIKGGAAGTVFKNYKAKFGSFPNDLVLPFDEWKRRQEAIYTEPIVICNEPVIVYNEPIVVYNEPIIVYNEPIIISFPEAVYDYWGVC